MVRTRSLLARQPLAIPISEWIVVELPGNVLYMDDLTEDELRVVEQRCAAALAGPWEAFVGPGLGGEEFIRTGGLDNAAPDMYVYLSYRSNDPPKPAAPADLEFIAAARQDIPRLLDEVRRLRSLLG